MISSEMFFNGILLFGPGSRISPYSSLGFSYKGIFYESISSFIKNKAKKISYDKLVELQRLRLLNNPSLVNFIKSFPEISTFAYCDTDDCRLGNGLSISSSDACSPSNFIGENLFGISLFEAFNSISK